MICRLRSIRYLAILLLVGGCARTVPAQSPGAPPSDAAGAAALDPKRFEADIRAFEAADRTTPPPLGGVVFVGSSSIKNWTEVAADFPGIPLLNRGFGGSTLADVVYYADRVVLPYRPRLVVLYAGDNDMAEGRTPDRVLGDYRAFVARLRSGASLQAYVDVFTPMLDATGEPRPELFLADSLHMTRAGYLLWRALLAPVVY